MGKIRLKANEGIKNNYPGVVEVTQEGVIIWEGNNLKSGGQSCGWQNATGEAGLVLGLCV